jgi:hypothetical protein
MCGGSRELHVREPAPCHPGGNAILCKGSEAQRVGADPVHPPRGMRHGRARADFRPGKGNRHGQNHLDAKSPAAGPPGSCAGYGRRRRVRRVELSKDGRTALARALPLWQRAQSGMTEILGQVRLDGLLDDLRAVVKLSRSRKQK